MKELTIPFDVAESITLLTLQDHLSYLEEELKNHKENGEWMHPEDVRKSEEEWIPSLRIAIKFFGGSI